MPDVAMMPTMDCEPPGSEITAHARSKSATGPTDYGASESSIRGFASLCGDLGLTPTLFVHPQVGERHRDLFLALRAEGACLGLHLHPYKLNPDYREDLGAYPAETQREILTEAIDRWEAIFDEHPRYVRPGVFSASDATYRVLSDLGFAGGSVSTPGRVKPDAAAVWAGAPLDPHRGHAAFRMLPGDLDFVDVPVTVDRARPVTGGHLGQGGYESLYVSDIEAEALDPEASAYDLAAVTRNTLERIKRERPAHPALVTNTHNNMAYGDPDHRARANLRTVARTAGTYCEGGDLSLEPTTLDAFVETVD
jgi:peptidoglycan/xylan/chitin deacetylase (PgdA/CDA1 family)